MEIKVYTIKLNPPRWVRNVIVYVALPVGVLVGAAVAVRAGGALTTFAAGTAIKADDVNANFANLNAAVTALQSRSAFRAVAGGGESFPAVQWTKASLGTEQFDLANEFDPSVSQFSPTTAGYYFVQCSVLLGLPTGALAYLGVRILVNGNVHVTGGSRTDEYSHYQSVSEVVSLAAADKVECWVDQETGSTQSMNVQFEAARVAQ